MRFTVLWMPEAEAQLLDLWSDFPAERGGLTEASDDVVRLLRDDPTLKGRPFGGCRVLIQPPIAVLYSIDEGDRKVKILQLKRL